MSLQRPKSRGVSNLEPIRGRDSARRNRWSAARLRSRAPPKRQPSLTHSLCAHYESAVELYEPASSGFGSPRVQPYGLDWLLLGAGITFQVRIRPVRGDAHVIRPSRLLG